MITPLRHWSLNRTIPTIDDTESLSVLELVGKNTTKINELIKDYNEFVDNVNKTIDDFENGINKDQEEFKQELTKILHDYLHMIDDKIKLQDLEINNAILYMKDNLSVSITNLINEMKLNGELDVAITNAFNNLGTRVETLENTEYTLEYEEGTENLILKKTVNGGA